jgi:hypothetical protein
LEKQKPGDPEFNVQEYILMPFVPAISIAMVIRKDSMRVNVLSNNDITEEIPAVPC